ncbi:MAG: hypothetical protein GOMPHAMPRED_008157 [Gomphillus americanus]|uniref:Uncharacterized protein n=1 Tax=Gomphillus americanus TaxID=1940652 RepID=A0A8H3IDG2_9LECA|nr:MAG: hypothetical protein GOMPHAMPRED_008157 [Gomphillus americanus]
MATATVCPVVGTTNNVLPPTHPEFNLDKPGQVCPVTNATTDHHKNLQKHPPVPQATADATKCPALEQTVSNDPKAQKLDDAVCPVVGTATTVLPPDHPSVEGKEDKECPITKAKVGHHKDTVVSHPPVQAGSEAQCPVVGAKA